MKRPIIWGSLSFLAGIYCYENAAEHLLFCGILFALLSICFFLLNKSALSFLILVCFLGGVGRLYLQNELFAEPQIARHNTTASFEGILCEEPRLTSDSLYSHTVLLQRVDHRAAHGRLVFYSRRRYDAGASLSGVGKLTSAQALCREGDSFGDYLLREHLDYAVTEPKISLTKGSVPARCLAAFVRLRSDLIRSLDDALPASQSGILIAISSGDRSRLTAAQKEVFLQTGTYHVVSVSGLHISILLAFAISLFRKLRIPPILRRFLCLPLPILLAIFTGGNIPVLRACIMGFLILLADCLWTEADPMNSLFLAAGVLLMYRPSDLFSASFLLSFCSTLGIVAFSDFFDGLLCRLHCSATLRSTLASSVSASVASLLVLLFYFQSFPLAALPANLLILPLFPILLIGIFAFWLISSAFTPLTPICAKALSFLCELLFGPLELLRAIPSVEAAVPNLFLCAAYAFLLVAFYFMIRRKAPYLLICLLVFCLACGGVRQWQTLHSDRLTRIENGGEDAIVLHLSDGKTVLFAGGHSVGMLQSYPQFLEYFQKNKYKTIDVFAFMNYNKNSVALFRKLCEDLRIGTVLYDPQEESAEWIEKIAERNRTECRRMPARIRLSEHSYCDIGEDFCWYREDRVLMQYSPQAGLLVGNRPVLALPGTTAEFWWKGSDLQTVTVEE